MLKMISLKSLSSNGIKLQGKLVKALETYRKAIEVDADNEKAHYNIAILYDLYLQDKSSTIKD